MRITHAAHIVHAFGYCDLYSIDLEADDAKTVPRWNETDGGIMGETSYERGFYSFNDTDPVDPRRIPPDDLQGESRAAWFKGWDEAQRSWHVAMRLRHK